ncbi:MAG: carboxylesterase family protein [Bifidobacteriaceae bacterium]|jgi:carboxylesterase type B|nr:carboxylesterase family protein [Bifidobacteriaceae bacterium]
MSPNVTTEQGILAGTLEDGLAVFRGVPFAAPPFGPRRFSPPVAPKPWDGIRPAVEAGDAPPQPISDDPIDRHYFGPGRQGEDCLNLEIWSPDLGAVNLPVMVWIHGGGFMTGAGSAPGYSGRTFARDGVVHVGINYRLGVEGFTYLGDGTDNLGLLDQVAALEWVARNIAAFGGDPHNVTIYGQSGGAVAVMSLLAMPAANGLYAKAIAQSGSPMASVDTDDAAEVTRRLAAKLGIAPTRAAFASVPTKRTVAETMPLAIDFASKPWRYGAQSLNISPFRAVHGTPSLPAAPLVAAASPAHDQPAIPLLTGTTRNEATFFLRGLGTLEKINPLAARLLEHYMDVDRPVRRAYRTGPRHIVSRVGLVEAAWTDWGLRLPTIRLAETRSAPSYLYEFWWASPNYPAGLGALHTVEMPFVRDDLAGVTALGAPGLKLVGADPPAELATEMHSRWVRFATTGDPGWPAYDRERRATMVFDTPSRVVEDPASPERQAWEGRR